MSNIEINEIFTILQDVGNHFVANNLGAWPFSSFSGPKFGENRTPWPGEILPMKPLSHFEMWLGSPSESIGEGVGENRNECII